MNIFVPQKRFYLFRVCPATNKPPGTAMPKHVGMETSTAPITKPKTNPRIQDCRILTKKFLNSQKKRPLKPSLGLY